MIFENIIYFKFIKFEFYEIYGFWQCEIFFLMNLCKTIDILHEVNFKKKNQKEILYKNIKL